MYDLEHWCYIKVNEPWTPKIFTDSEPPIKLLIGGLIIGAPDPPTPPMGGAKIYFGGLLLMDHSDHHCQIFNRPGVAGAVL